MKFRGTVLIVCAGLILGVSGAQAAPDFGAKATGSNLETPGIEEDGGPGSASASVSRADYSAEASYPASATYLPQLRAFASNPTQDNDDDRTNGTAQAYQVFSSSAAQTIDVNVSLHGIVVDGSGDSSFVLADVYLYGGSEFEVSESPICPNGSLGRYMFDQTYFCGSRFGWANLHIPTGDVTRGQTLSFSAAAGETFGVYAILRASAGGGTADASQTLTLDFTDDEFIAPVSIPGAGETPVAIDILPGNDLNPVKPGSGNAIPVAVLGSDSFDVLQIDPTTLAFGPGAAFPVEKQRKGQTQSGFLVDVNGDDVMDLLSFYLVDETGIVEGETGACVTGELADLSVFMGCDAVFTGAK